MRPQNGKAAAVDRGGRDSWERTIHLDGRPVDRYTLSSGKLARPHRLLKGAKGSSSPLVEEAVGKDRRSKDIWVHNTMCAGFNLACVWTSVCGLLLSLIHVLSSCSYSPGSVARRSFPHPSPTPVTQPAWLWSLVCVCVCVRVCLQRVCG